MRHAAEHRNGYGSRACRGRNVIVQQQQRWLPQTAGMFHRDDRRCVQSQKHPPTHPISLNTTLSHQHASGMTPTPHPQALIPQSEVTGQSRQMARSCLVVKTQQVLRCQKATSHFFSLSLTSSPLSAPCKPWPPSPQEGRAGLSRV